MEWIVGFRKAHSRIFNSIGRASASVVDDCLDDRLANFSRRTSLIAIGYIFFDKARKHCSTARDRAQFISRSCEAIDEIRNENACSRMMEMDYDELKRKRRTLLLHSYRNVCWVSGTFAGLTVVVNTYVYVVIDKDTGQIGCL